MAIHNDIGKKGEEIASEYVVSVLNFELIAKNLHIGRAELDIIAKDTSGNYHLIEVKTRSNNYQNPEDFVDDKKLKLLFDAMKIYKENNQIEAEFFIDILAISNMQNQPKIEYFQDVYYGQDFL